MSEREDKSCSARKIDCSTDRSGSVPSPWAAGVAVAVVIARTDLELAGPDIVVGQTVVEIPILVETNKKDGNGPDRNL